MNWKRALTIIGVCLAVLLGSGYGAYRYVLRHYAQQIDNLLVDLAADAGESQPPTDGVPAMMPGDNSEVQPTTDPTVPTTPAQVDPEATSKATSILEQMSLSEKVTAVQAMSKFTTSELLEMYRQYASGDKGAKQSVKEKLEGRFSEEDLRLFREIANKYR